jgi:hypothetical protein
VLEGVVRSVVRTEFRVKIAQNSYADGVTHTCHCNGEVFLTLHSGQCEGR